MSNEIISGLYRTKITLPGVGMDYLNSYIIGGEDKVGLVDTGIDTEQAFKEMLENLNQLGLSTNDLTCVLITHFHIDHVGLFSRIKDSRDEKINAKLSSKEYEYLKKYAKDFNSFWQEQFEYGKLNGVPDKMVNKLKILREDFRDLTIYDDLANAGIPIEDGEGIKIGKYQFTLLTTSGHSPGHACYYEPREKILIAGDHLLKNTTPNITKIRENENPLSDYLRSLDKINDLEIKYVLPAHGKPYQDHKKRIKQLKNHHEERLREIKNILGKKQQSAYKIASRLDWDLNYPDWRDFPTLQKWLAAGETLAHLKYLEKQGEVEKVRKNKTILYKRK